MTDTRTEILETARAILLEEGYDALSANRIAERMEITDAGVHYHFETADDLAVGVVDHLEAEYVSRVDGDDDRPPDERLAETVREWFEAAEAVRDLTAPPGFQLITAASSGNDELRDALVSVSDTYVETVAETIHEGMETGVFETDDPERVAEFLASTIDAAAVRSALDQSTVPIAEGVTEHVLDDLYVEDPPTVVPASAPEPSEVNG